MKRTKRVIKALIFVILTLSIFLKLDNAFFSTYTVSTSSWDDIENKKNKIDVLFLGSSHTMCDINSYFLSEALNLQIDSLAASIMPMPAVTENFRIALKYQKPKVAVLDVSVIGNENLETYSTETRGCMYGNFDGASNPIYRIAALSKMVDFDSLPFASFQLLRSENRWTRWYALNAPKERSNFFDGYDLNGYLWSGNKSYATGDMDIRALQQRYISGYQEVQKKELIDYNEQALREFFELAVKNNVEVWLFNPPDAYYSEDLIGKIKTLKIIADEYNCVKYFDNLNLVYNEIGMQVDDFYDASHLNQKGAQKVTEYLGSKISKRLLNEDVEYNNAFFYKGESVEKIGDLLYRYSMQNYKDVLYRFTLYCGETEILSQDFSKNNYIDLDIDIRENKEYRLKVQMLPFVNKDEVNYENRILTTQFMQKNECILVN